MIKANEIRIGNAIWDDTRKRVRYVTHRIISDIASSAQPLPYSPIPLTAEWLERFGFATDVPYEDSSPVYLRETGTGKNFYVDYHSLQPIDAGFNIASYKIEYVHQLQNLYFALTGEELKIKETV